METDLASKAYEARIENAQLNQMCVSNGPLNVLPTPTGPNLNSQSISSKLVRLQPIDSLDVTILVDNSIDIFLPSDDAARRPRLTWDWSEKPQLVAEHGYSALLTVHRNGESRSVLYDAGLGKETAVHNLEVLGLNLDHVEGMVLSHGHADHHGGLEGVLRRIGRKNLPFILHPDAWQDRKIVFPTGTEIHLPPPSKKTLEDQEVKILEERGPTLLLDGTLLVSGQVERLTSFEKGFPIHHVRFNGGWKPDPWIWDDQGIICNVKGLGLIVVSSCSHSGAVNILHNAQRITGVKKVHAFIGGLHLTGGIFEKIIPETVEQLKEIGPRIVVPGHCTGWKATQHIARTLPESYVPTSVGTQMSFH